MIPLLGYKVIFDGKPLLFHSIDTYRTYSKRNFWMPWKKFWYYEVQLFNLFEEGSYRLTSRLFHTQKAADATLIFALEHIKLIMKSQEE